LAIEIVPLTEGHLAGFHAAVDTVARERKYLSRTEAAPVERMKAWVAASLAKGGVHLVALDGSSVVGWCDINRHDAPSQAHRGILGMGLLPDHRGQGVGRALLTRAVTEGHAKGIFRIELDVHADNLAAIALYRRCGFIEEGRRVAAARIDGVYKDLVLMAHIDRVALGL
jgi:RimJ/RimL family protein N-acetyltransferase